MTCNYCVECGAALSQVSHTEYHCTNGHIYWNNPKAAVIVVFYKDGQVLYALRAHEPAKGKYDFPGGFVDFGENALQAINRELYEETGTTGSTLELIGSVGNRYTDYVSTCDFVYLCRDWQGTVTPGDDVADLVWKPLKFVNSPEFAWEYPGLYELLVDATKNL